jgi:hypothetical protein
MTSSVSKKVAKDLTKLLPLLMTSVKNNGNDKGRRLSAAAEKKIEIANRTWGKAKETVLDAYKQLLNDGWSPLDAGDICRDRLTIFSPRTLREILPDEAKHRNMIRLPAPSKKQENGTGNEQPSQSHDDRIVTTQVQEVSRGEIAAKVPQFPSGLTAEEKQMLLANPGLKQALDSLPVNPNPSTRQRSNKQQQQIEEEEPQEIYQIPPEQYSIQDLDKYDFNKRGEIILYLHKENERLRTRIAEFLSVVSPPSPASYEEAREYAYSQGITSRSQWREHTKSDKFPNNIPKRPDSVFADKGWSGWAAFFDNGRSIK